MNTILYRTHFLLAADVIDFDAAKAYLAEDDMTKYLLEDERSASCRDKIKSIKWILKNEYSGYIDLETTSELTSLELDSISDWVSGQNSDGLGEGFEQQDFACYKDKGFLGCEDYNDDEEEDWNGEYVMASFDWQSNSYKFEKVNNQ